MNIKVSVAIALPALLCGAVLGYFLHTPEAPAPAVPASAAKPAAAGKMHAPADDAALNRLRRRVQDLERQLAAARAQPAGTAQLELVAAPTNTPSPFARGGRPGFPTAAEMRAHMEEMRKNDPERFAQMTNHFARMQARRLERTQNRLELLASVDTSHMTKQQRAVHDQYQDLIARREELRALMNPQDESITETQRQEAFKEMRELDGKLRELAHSERDTLLSQTATSFGIQGDDAGELVETVKAVFQATENHGHGFGGPPPGGPGGPPPGGAH